ncbi:MAG: FAD-binding oxidoreductase [Sutterellaceae bacterium]|nr:FAD-binding oxidoreductase [Sutterellaceae bacterium]
MDKTQAIEELKAIVGVSNVLTEDADTAGYLVDWTNRFHGKVLAVVRPADTDEVSRVMKWAYDTGTVVVPQSGNTSLVGGGTPDASGTALLLSLSRMNKVEAIDAVNDTMTVQAGLVLEKAQEAAESAGRFFPLSFAAEGTACLGGCLATNAGGTAVLRYGNTRDLVLGIEVVLADGRVLNMLRGLRKDNTGYDLKHLFMASEGTLGVITRAVVKLFPQPQASYTALVGVANVEDAYRLLSDVKTATGPALTGFELMQAKCIERVAEQIDAISLPGDVTTAPWWCLVELSYSRDPQTNPLEAILEKSFEEGYVVDAILSNSVADSRHFWSIRESIPSADAHVGGNLHNDVSIEISQIADFVKEALDALNARFDWIDPSVFGHLGDGNLHFNIGSIPANLAFENEEGIRETVYTVVQKYNGSISAEHGIGQLKRAHFLQLKNPLELEVMGRIKQALDPKGILNPGKLLADDYAK